MNGGLALLLAIVCEVIGSTGLKASEGFTKPLPSAVVLLGYAAAFFFVSLALKTLPLNTVYAIWAGAGTALISLVGVVVLGERLNWPMGIGIALIVVGVALLHLYGAQH
jgi:small multidrug resistance pump